jgi:hypothetical protein
MRRFRSGAGVLLAVAGATALASMASAAPRPVKFAVTFSATHTSTFRYDECAPNGLTMNATITSVQPITATLTGGRLTFAPDLAMHNQPLQMTANMSQTACPNLATARTCGPTTGLIKPGFKELSASSGKLVARYQSSVKFFSDADSCSSGIIEMGVLSGSDPGKALLNPADLLRKKTTNVTGTWVHDMTFTGHGHDAAEHTVVAFTVRFERLP